MPAPAWQYRAGARRRGLRRQALRPAGTIRSATTAGSSATCRRCRSANRRQDGLGGQPAVVRNSLAPGRAESAEKIRHSYPHCWRHKTPIIFRATTQWFIGMEHKKRRKRPTLRWVAERAVDETQFFPAWGRAAGGDDEDRPDWCVSRQRNWGVPIRSSCTRETGEPHPRTAGTDRGRGASASKGGHRSLVQARRAELLGEEAGAYRKMRDTLDVWFDSGTTHLSVMRGSARRQARIPADLYLEGSDQHRGWFQSRRC